MYWTGRAKQWERAFTPHGLTGVCDYSRVNSPRFKNAGSELCDLVRCSDCMQSFYANPSHRIAFLFFFRTDITDSRTVTDTFELIRFYLFIYFFYIFSSLFKFLAPCILLIMKRSSGFYRWWMCLSFSNMLLVSANTDVFFVCMCNIVLKNHLQIYREVTSSGN